MASTDLVSIISQIEKLKYDITHGIYSDIDVLTIIKQEIDALSEIISQYNSYNYELNSVSDNIYSCILDKYLDYKVNVIDLSSYKANSKININLIFFDTTTSLAELIIKIPYNEFLNSNYDTFITSNSNTDSDINYFLNFIADSSNTINKKIKLDYFLNETINEFFIREKENIDENTNQLIIKLSLQSEFDNYFTIGLVSIFKD